MPTASPSITASSGVVDEMVVKTVATKMSATASPTPMMALMSGNHATAIERNVIMSTNSAMSTPIASMIVSVGTAVENRSPPRAA